MEEYHGEECQCLMEIIMIFGSIQMILIYLIQANDGGANVSHNGGKTWSTQFNQPTAEIYQVEVDDQYPYWLYGGQQDNYTTIAVPSFPPYAIQDVWKRLDY